MRNTQIIIFLSLFLLLLCFLTCIPTLAHSGKTDSKGGHYDSSTGQYHYHHGYPAHSHYDMDHNGTIDCPYQFNNKTNHSNNTNTKSNNNSVQNNYTSPTNSNNYSSSNLYSSPKEEPKQAQIFVEILFDIIGFLFYSSLLLFVLYPIWKIIIFSGRNRYRR